jgi:hypothetical protein
VFEPRDTTRRIATEYRAAAGNHDAAAKVDAPPPREGKGPAAADGSSDNIGWEGD